MTVLPTGLPPRLYHIFEHPLTKANNSCFSHYQYMILSCQSPFHVYSAIMNLVHDSMTLTVVATRMVKEQGSLPTSPGTPAFLAGDGCSEVYTHFCWCSAQAHTQRSKSLGDLTALASLVTILCLPHSACSTEALGSWTLCGNTAAPGLTFSRFT